MDIMLIVVLGILGALLGSFACAQVWRLRARQLVQDKADGEKVDSNELKRLKGLIRPALRDRSECLHCHHQLAWFDLLPIISWVSIGGKCRYCREPIGVTELLSEVGLAAVFVVSYLAWPLSLTDSAFGLLTFVFWLVACVVMTILFIYDAKWSLLPFSLNISLIFIGIMFQVSLFLGGAELHIGSLLMSVGLLGGIYLIFSFAGWVGMGDGILGIGLGLLLGDWQYAFLALFLANLFGCFMLIPLYFKRQLRHQARIPFGPFMILGAIVTLFFGEFILSYIFGSSGYVHTMLML